MVIFPKDFLWGAATSAHQVEGGNIHNDWWDWEQKGGVKEPSGEACRHYELYPQDFDLAASLCHNAHRFSIEWSRIEPRPGDCVNAELRHYCEVTAALRRRRIEPVVTLHHFTNPRWLAAAGGWQMRSAVDSYLRYVRNTAEALCAEVRYWVTINEPLVYVYYGYIKGAWPPHRKSFAEARRAEDNLAFAHREAYRIIHGIYRNRNLPPPRVSIAQNMQAFEPCSPTLKNRLAAYLRQRSFNFAFIDRLIRYRSLDYLGVNYYTRNLAEPRSWRLTSLLMDDCIHNHHPRAKNDMGWDIYPEGLFDLLCILKRRYNLPFFILENGICTADDRLRWDFIRSHLLSLYQAMQKGAGVLGYLHWSLLDNYEWDKGFAPRFGLIAVDYATQKRTVRESARLLSEVYATGRLDDAAAG